MEDARGVRRDARLGSDAERPHLTLHGVVRHLENVERSWFREFFGGQTGLHFDWTDEDPDADMRAEGVPMAELLASYAAETELCDEVIAAASSLDATAVDPDGTYSLRWVVVHMIEETGRHLGHIARCVNRRTARSARGHRRTRKCPTRGCDRSLVDNVATWKGSRGTSRRSGSRRRPASTPISRC
ncbi:MAG: DUF664 domain-containing protein [Actinobacteria bacterium]|nr:DUF664 domain-containing protein [Actinomycetota bacterium]